MSDIIRMTAKGTVCDLKSKLQYDRLVKTLTLILYRDRTIKNEIVVVLLSTVDVFESVEIKVKQVVQGRTRILPNALYFFRHSRARNFVLGIFCSAIGIKLSIC